MLRRLSRISRANFATTTTHTLEFRPSNEVFRRGSISSSSITSLFSRFSSLISSNLVTPKRMMAVPTIKLSNGLGIPQIGLGTWRSEVNQVEEAVKIAVDAGYRHFDCAFAYENEKEVGKALQEKFREGVIKREDVFITSKVWNTYHSKDGVGKCLRQTLEDLQTDYLDLYLIHWPMGYKEGGPMFPKDVENEWLLSDVDYVETWKAMEELTKQGLIRSIGLSNFNSEQTKRVYDMAKIKPVINQVECHPYFKQEKLLEFCKKYDVVLTSYACLGSPTRPWANDTDPVVLENPVIKAVAEKYKKKPAQICLRYQIQRGLVVIPKSVNKERIESNFQVFDFEITKEDMKLISDIPDKKRLFELEWVKHHPHYPFHIPY